MEIFYSIASWQLFFNLSSIDFINFGEEFVTPELTTSRKGSCCIEQKKIKTEREFFWGKKRKKHFFAMT
jgi:hypothetical protein